MKTGSRIKQLRKEKGWTQEDLIARLISVKCKITRTSISRWENNWSMPDAWPLQCLALLFGVSLDYLVDGKVNAIKPIRINVLGRVPAGVPVEAVEDIVDWEELDPRTFSPSHEYFGLLVRGDSMYPKYMEGDIIICQREDDAESGRDVVAYMDGYDALVKQLIKYDNGNIELRPLNTAHPPRVFTPEQAEREPVKILGFVREIRRKV